MILQSILTLSLLLSVVLTTKFHGELLGFENLYIIDGSNDPRCISFLRYARDTLGANVLFSAANLNQLVHLLNQIRKNIGPSSDFILKVDTDEFLQVYNEKERALSTSLVHDYLKGFATNITHVLRQAGSFHVGYIQNSVASRKVCTNSADPSGIDVTAFPLGKVEVAGNFKAVYNSNRFFKTEINLGGHNFPNKAEGHRSHSDFGILHFHQRCFHHEVKNTKKALISHNYINATDNNEEALTKVRRLFKNKEDLCNSRVGGGFNSWHKVLFYGRYLQCPNSTEESFYTVHEVGPQNNEFRDFLQMAEGKYTVFRIG
jgi:hypothetical protein